MDGHTKLPLWQAARRLVGEIYALTRELPAEERFVAVAQLRRAAWSVSNNIAEGNARRGRGMNVRTEGRRTEWFPEKVPSEGHKAATHK